MPTYKNIYYADGATAMVSSQISYDEMSSAGDAIEDVERNIPIKVASSAERDDKYPTPVAGDAVWRTDIGVEQRYSASEPIGWYSATTGLMNIKPSDVVFGAGTGAVSESGLITFTNVNTILVSGVFGPAFKNYKLIFNLQSTSAAGANINLTYAAEGVQDTSSNYYRSNFYSNSATVAGGYGAGQAYMGALVGAGPSANVRSGLAEVTFFNPYAGKPVSQITHLGSGAAIAPVITQDNGYYNSATAAFDGFYIYQSASITFSGSMLVYGFN